MNLKRFSIYGIISLVLILLVAAYYFSNSGKENFKNVKPKYFLDPLRLNSDFMVNVDSSYIKYYGQIIQVTGKALNIRFGDKGAYISLLFELGGVTCVFDKDFTKANHRKLSKIKIGDEVTIKGKCGGFDSYWGVILTGCYY
jgi:hypothetical protein